MPEMSRRTSAHAAVGWRLAGFAHGAQPVAMRVSQRLVPMRARPWTVGAKCWGSAASGQPVNGSTAGNPVLVEVSAWVP